MTKKLAYTLLFLAGCQLTPGEQQGVRTALDVAKLGCVIEHALLDRATLDKVCAIVDAEEPLVDQALGDLQRHDAAMRKLGGCKE